MGKGPTFNCLVESNSRRTGSGAAESGAPMRRLSHLLRSLRWQSGGMRTRRNSLRSPVDDYRTPGAYFITVCVFNRRRILSQVVGGKAHPSPLGRLVLQEWADLPQRFDWLAIDAFVVMPDHFHGILWITDSIARQCPRSDSGPPRRSVGVALGQMKSRVTKAAILQGIGPSGERLWQRGYHDRIVRTESGLFAARGYIAANPIRWERAHGCRR